MGDGPLADAYAVASRSSAPPVDPITGAALRFLAAAIGARSAVEVGTGCGVSGVWLLRGMVPDSILTTVDTDAEYQNHARAVFGGEGFGTGRARLIRGRALEVLPRLTDGGYDLVFVDADREAYLHYLDEARRLLRPGGVMVFHGSLTASAEPDGPLRVPDPAETVARELVQRVREDGALVPLLMPVGEGLLAAIRP
ncbi:O-methyltransferase [Nocardiopsis lucentensis]|uniref:O-methyltransferase n=1 Tax=Nocardiopsis lucentensis TaxID=53441 RepID=UPI00034D523F|nr:class I SAM-dependent methyltransferase [Nocardiopsis lucentensis]